jgi:uncharacterized protein (DUF2062 family)
MRAALLNTVGEQDVTCDSAVTATSFIEVMLPILNALLIGNVSPGLCMYCSNLMEHWRNQWEMRTRKTSMARNQSVLPH